MNELINTPLCNREDLGRPMPDSVHAVSACLPLWEHNVGYEEADPAVVDKMQCGYPRFFLHPLVVQVFEECERQFASRDECCFAFPSCKVAERFAEYLLSDTGERVAVHDYDSEGIFAVCFPRSARKTAMDFWQHTGEIVSSRLAVAVLEAKKTNANREQRASESGVKQKLGKHIAELTKGRTGDVFLFPNGMAAIYCAQRVVQSLRPDRKSAQFGFPYVDTLKLLEKFGTGVHLFAKGDSAELSQLEELLRSESITALFCEFPSNPLLNSPDLKQLNHLAAQYEFPIVVDDTLGAFINTGLLSGSDLLVTSLTKFFSGSGDVMGGSVVLNPQSRFYEELKTGFASEYEDLLFKDDAFVLDQNSRDVAERVARINRSSEEVCEMIRRHPAVKRVDYPKYNMTDNYRAYLREGGGYGGLFSIQLHNPAENAPRFFDALGICKGPNLGTNFSLCCPFTILAHFHELDFAESCNVSQFLLRVSIGLEDVEWLKSRFREALDQLPASEET